MTIATTTTTTTSSVTADRKVIIPDGVGGAACAAVGAKTARACDYCVRKRARWYCAADDAFLCQLCDGSVHSANPLARRHNRVRLKTASSSTTTTKKKPGDVELSVNIPSWQRGLKRKPRTPRGHRAKQSMWTRAAGGGEKAAAAALWKKRRSLVVPEFGVEDNSASTTSHDEEEEEEDERQLVYRVPVFDPFESELCTSNYSSSAVNNNSNNNDIKSVFTMSGGGDVESGGGVGVGVFMPSDLDLEEFERLLGKGLDGDDRHENQSCCLYGIEEEKGEEMGGGLLDHCGDIISTNITNNHRNPNTIHHQHNSNDNARLDCSNYLIKPEEEEEATKFEGGLFVDETIIEPFELTFDYDDGDYDYPMPPLPTKGEDRCEMELHVKANGSTTTAELEVARGEDGGGSRCQNDNRYLKKMVSLKLQDYDAIANAWHQQTAGTCAGSSPWIDGERPSISPDECNWWPHQHYHHHPFFVPGSEDHPNLPFGHHHQQQQQGIIGPGNVVVVGGVGGGEGREARVSRYREKRRTRLFSKKIRYEVRKLNAEKRPRVKGRFVKRTGSTGTAPPATGAAAPAAAATAKPVRVGRQKVK